MSGHVIGLIDEVLTGRVLSADSDAEFRGHLRSCDACRAHYDQSLNLLRLTGGGRAPGELERLTIRAVRLVKPTAPPSVWPWKSVLAGTFALAAVLITVVAWPRAQIGVVLQAGKGLVVDGVAANKDTVILEGALVTTDKEDSAVLLRDEQHKRGVLLRGNTTVRLVSMDEVELVSGRVRLQVKDPKESLVVRTTSAGAPAGGNESLRVVQDTAGVFIVEQKPASTLVAVHQGRVVVRSASTSVELNEGQEAELTPNGGLSVARPVAGNSLIEDRGDGTVWGAILRFLRQLLDVITKALAGD